MRRMASQRFGVCEIKAQTRILRSQLEQRHGSRIDEKDPLMSWRSRHPANCVLRYRTMVERLISDDVERLGNVPVTEFGESVHFRPVGENNALRGGDQRLLRGVYVGHHERSGAAIFPHARRCEEGNENCENAGTREMGSRVQCNVCWISLEVEAGSTESGETCCF